MAANEAELCLHQADPHATSKEAWSVVDVNSETKQFLTVTLNEIEPGWGMMRGCLSQLSDWYNAERVTAGNMSFVGSLEELSLDAKFGLVTVMRAADIETCDVDIRVEPWKLHFQTLNQTECPDEESQVFERLSTELHTGSLSLESIALCLPFEQCCNKLQIFSLAKSLDIPTHEIERFTRDSTPDWSKDLVFSPGNNGELTMWTDCGGSKAQSKIVSWTIDKITTLNSVDSQDATLTKPKLFSSDEVSTKKFQEELEQFVLGQTADNECYVQQKPRGNVESDNAPFKIRIEILG